MKTRIGAGCFHRFFLKTIEEVEVLNPMLMQCAEEPVTALREHVIDQNGKH